MLVSDRIVEIELGHQLIRVNKTQPLPLATNNQACTSFASKDDARIALPEVNFKLAQQRSPDGFALPKEYIKSNVNEEKTDENHVEYDMDEEDYVWLKLANERRKKQKLKPITETIFEQAMDRLEKESHFQSFENGEMSAWQSSLSDQCCICNDAEDSNYNQIIYCDLCNIPVHQECYGVPYIPEGQWLCRRCQLSPSEPVRCVLCPYTDGAFKQTSDGQWAHVICALWLNEVHFANAVFLEPIEGVDFSLKRRAKLRCLVCKQPKVGACLQCSKKSCTRSFHVTCAYFAGMCMTIEGEEDHKNNSTIINRYVFCHEHFPQKAGDKTKSPPKRILVEKLKKARKMMNSQEQKVPHVSVPVIPSKKVTEIKKSLNLQSIEDICHYWALKRKSRCGVPLIRRLQVYHNNTKTASPQKQPTAAARRVNITPEFYTAMSLRTNLEKVRLLCELVKKREKLKNEHVTTSEALVDNFMKPLSMIMQETLEKLISKDHQNVFVNPVSEKDVPGYHSIIKKPMNFHRMRSRLDMGEYKRVAELRSDFNLMMDNCSTFNKNNPFFWNYGHRIRRIGLKIIKTAEVEESHINSNKWLSEISKQFDLNIDASSLPTTSLNLIDKSPKKPQSLKLNSNPAQRILKTALKNRNSALKPANRKSLDSSTSKNKKIVDYFPIVSTNNGSMPLKSTPARTSRSSTFTIPRNERIGYVTEMSSADSDNGPMSGEELDNMPPPKKRCLRTSSRPIIETHNGIHDFHHHDIVWTPSDDESKLPARVIDIRNRVMLDHDEEQQLNKFMKQNPIPSVENHTLVALFDSANTWRWFPTRKLRICEPFREFTNNSNSSQLNSAMRRAKQFWNEICQ